MAKTCIGRRTAPSDKDVPQPPVLRWGQGVYYPGAVQATSLAALNPEAFSKLRYIATDILLTNAKLLMLIMHVKLLKI